MSSPQSGWQSLDDFRRESVLAAGIDPEDFDRFLSQDGGPAPDRPLNERAALLADGILMNWMGEGREDPTNPWHELWNQPIYGPPKRDTVGALITLAIFLAIPVLIGLGLAFREESRSAGLVILAGVAVVGAVLWFVTGRMSPR